MNIRRVLGMAVFLLPLSSLPGCKLLSKEHRACSHLAQICEEGTEQQARIDSCEKELNDLRSSAGSEAVDRTITCIQEAKSCVSAAGCMVGGIGGGMLNEFIKGVQKALPK
ncbi:MAG: hypothetical protein JNJ46_11605 [Myxococcales bacterium]|nr:hypothetical protein [Myxococcales bacterium]